MGGLIGMTAVLSLFAGLTLGWYLRRANTWCPHCGHSLTCSACGHRPASANEASANEASTGGRPSGTIPSQRTAS
jgi:hypothetical protein